MEHNESSELHKICKWKSINNFLKIVVLEFKVGHSKDFLNDVNEDSPCVELEKYFEVSSNINGIIVWCLSIRSSDWYVLGTVVGPASDGCLNVVSVVEEESTD